MEFTNELKERLLKIAPAQFGHHIEHGFMHPRIKPADMNMKIAGPAYTVRATERDGSALYYAIMKAPKGSVIVVDLSLIHIFPQLREKPASVPHSKEKATSLWRPSTAKVTQRSPRPDVYKRQILYSPFSQNASMEIFSAGVVLIRP